jgi:hypothetical protein
MAVVGTDPVGEVHAYRIQGLEIKTGDLICTTDGGRTIGPGQFWWLVGKLIPGDVDHIAVYVGPQGRCVEAGAKGRVVAFEVPGEVWDAAAMLPCRGFEDVLYGVAYPLAKRGLSQEQEVGIRLGVASFCLAHAAKGTSYNLNFLDSNTEKAFYCSQLAYKAYLPHGIDLNTERGVPAVPFTKSIVFPQEVWAACRARQRA